MILFFVFISMQCEVRLYRQYVVMHVVFLHALRPSRRPSPASTRPSAGREPPLSLERGDMLPARACASSWTVVVVVRTLR
jgi:hypothetical protein